MKKIIKNTRLMIGTIIILLSFICLLVPISDYGTNWDEPQHFSRGYAYLHYLLTGKTNFNDIPKYPPFKGDSEFGNFRGAQEQLEYIQQHPELADPSFRRSVYIYDSWNAEYYLKSDSGHPPLNGILAALSNYIFYTKLGLFDDINAYHLFEILTGVLLIGVVYFFSSKHLGIFAGVIASLSLLLYPLFFGEVHFNIKDPPEAAFYGLMVFSFFNGIIKKNFKWLLLSAVSAGFALGTKLNVIFSVFILIPWLLVYSLSQIKRTFNLNDFLRKNSLVILGLIMFPIIMCGIFFLSWPYLWSNTFSHLNSILFYYKDIGTNVSYQPRYLLDGGWNTYAVLWIIFTTPPFVLFLSGMGVIFSIYNFRKDKYKVRFLFLLWFLIPVLRVSIPGSSIYGGVRQIMEFVPGMALLSAVGAEGIKTMLKTVTKKLGAKKYVQKRILLTFFMLVGCGYFQIVYTLIKLHPNENLYFNSLIGGLKGAVERDIPSWGNSYGNVYLQGVRWINSNAPKDSRLALVSGTMINVPRIRLRKDIIFSNNRWSGVSRQGEYMMDMIYQGFPIKTYAYEYLQTYLNPVHTVTVDSIPVLRIWKNDKEHTKPGYLNEDSNVKIADSRKDRDNRIVFKLSDMVYLTRLDMWYDNNLCEPVKEGFIEISQDGVAWERQGETFPVLQVTMDVEPKDKRLVYLFAAKKAKYIRIITDSSKSCLFNPTKIEISKLSDLK